MGPGNYPVPIYIYIQYLPKKSLTIPWHPPVNWFKGTFPQGVALPPDLLGFLPVELPLGPFLPWWPAERNAEMPTGIWWRKKHRSSLKDTIKNDTPKCRDHFSPKKKLQWQPENGVHFVFSSSDPDRTPSAVALQRVTLLSWDFLLRKKRVLDSPNGNL